MEREGALWKQTVFYAQIRENAQTLFFFFTKAESKVFTVIARKEFGSESLLGAGIRDPGYSFCDQVVEVGKVFIAQSAKTVRDLFWIADFGTDKPERVNERDIEQSHPLFSEVPETEFIPMLLAKADRLITDQ